MKTLIKILLPIVIVAVGLTAFFLLRSSKPEPVAIEAPEKQWVVEAIEVNPGSHRPLAELYGRIDSPDRSRLSAAVSAEVVNVRVREGQSVNKGDLLIEIDPRDLELQLKQREAELAELKARLASERNTFDADQKALEDEQALLKLAERNLARAEKLARTNAGSEAGVDEALQVIGSRRLAITQRQRSIDDHSARMAQLNANLARLNAVKSQVETNLARTRIAAPFDGRITTVHVSRGEWVRVGDPLAELYNTAELEVRAQIPERYVGNLQSSLNRKVVMHAKLTSLDQSFPVVLDRFAGSIRQGQGGVDAFFRFTQAPPSLEVGRVLPLYLELPAVENSILLPASALYGSNTVYRIVDDRLQNVAVTYEGERRAADGALMVLVTSSGLNVSDRVVTTQIPAAVNGLKVVRSGQ